MIRKTRLLVPLCGLFIAIASSWQDGKTQATYSEIMGCEAACEVAAGGWPFPYVVDYPGISVVGSADLTGALLGEDRFVLLSFTLTALFWTAMAAAAVLLWRWARRRSAG